MLSASQLSAVAAAIDCLPVSPSSTLGQSESLSQGTQSLSQDGPGLFSHIFSQEEGGGDEGKESVGDDGAQVQVEGVFCWCSLVVMFLSHAPVLCFYAESPSLGRLTHSWPQAFESQAVFPFIQTSHRDRRGGWQ